MIHICEKSFNWVVYSYFILYRTCWGLITVRGDSDWILEKKKHIEKKNELK